MVENYSFKIMETKEDIRLTLKVEKTQSIHNLTSELNNADSIVGKLFHAGITFSKLDSENYGFILFEDISGLSHDYDSRSKTLSSEVYVKTQKSNNSVEKDLLYIGFTKFYNKKSDKDENFKTV